MEMQSKIKISSTSVRIAKNKKATNADENVGEREPPLLLLVLQPGAAPL